MNRIGVIAFILSLPASAVSAQTVEPVALERALLAIHDTLALDAMARGWEDPRSRADGAAQIALGMTLVRRWELSGSRRDLDRARAAFERARDIAPADPWGHWGTGLVLARGPGVQSNGPVLAITGRSWSRMLGLNDRAKARRALEKALALDPRFDRAAAVLAELALQDRDPDGIRAAYDVLLRVLSGRDVSEHSLIMLARVADALEDHQTAMRAAELATLSPDASPDAVHALAIAMLRTPGQEAGGTRVWHAAIDRLTPALAERVWAETSPIARASEKEKWAKAGLAGRKAILKNLWEVRAGSAGVEVHERLAEHYRRLGFALAQFTRRTDGPMLPNAINQQWPDAPVDERGVIYIRHGEPIDIIHTAPMLSPGSAMCRMLAGEPTILGSPDGKQYRAPAQWRTSGAMDNESWVYPDENGRYRLMNFLRCKGFVDYAIPYDVPCGSEWAEERKGYDMDLRFCDVDTRERVRSYTREAFATDTHQPAFEAELPFAFDLFAFRGTGGRTDLSAPIAVLSDSLRADTLADGTLIHALTVSMFIVDTVNASVVRADTAMRYRYEPAPARGEAVVASINLSVEPKADALLRIRVRERARPERGRVHGQHIRVPGFSVDSLELSSIVLAVPGQGGNWRRGATQLTVMPIGEFAGGDFRVFYEIYNLPEDAPYRTEITVERIRDGLGRVLDILPGTDPAIQLRFDDIARPDGSGVVQELRSVESDLEPGHYRIRVRVSNLVANDSVTNERLFSVTRAR